MFWILLAGILLTALPILGFAICGTIMMFGTMGDDDDGDKVLAGVIASISIGLAMIVIYYGTTFLSDRL